MTVSVQTLTKILAELKREYEALHRAAQSQREIVGEQMLTAMLAFTPHAAYHLGAIRQLIHAV